MIDVVYGGRRYPCFVVVAAFAVYRHLRKWREAKQGKAELLDEGPSSLFANLRPLLICQNCQVPIPNTNTNTQ